jgi:uncharacterized membrane protein
METNIEHGHQHHSKNIGMAILAYLGILIIIPFLTDAKKDPFVKFHLKQGLVLIIAWIIISALKSIPLGFTINWILWILLVIFMLIGVINAANGREKELPLIGHFAKNFNF